MALHAGAALGLLIGEGGELLDELRDLVSRRLLVLALATAPAALAGLGLEHRIQSRLGTPPTIAAGLLVGGLAMALADRSPEHRRAGEADLRDGLWLGLAQASALIPGVSRGGATLAAARWRRFRRADAARLSEALSWPVITGATLLKARRVGQGDLREHRSRLCVGATASLLSTLAASRFGGRNQGRPLLPYAVYRAGLAAVILLRLRRDAAAQR